MRITQDNPSLHMPWCTAPTLSALLLLVLSSMMIGCGGPPKVHTTFLNSVDLVAMTDQMAQSFTQHDVINQRRQHDEPWIISIYRIINHTNQIIPERERWLYIGRLRALLGQSDLSQHRNLIWIVPPERWPIIAAETGQNEPPTLRLQPTHLLTAEFSTLTITHARGRSDTYLCAYELVDLHSGQVIWQDKWEVKRAVTGLTYD